MSLVLNNRALIGIDVVVSDFFLLFLSVVSLPNVCTVFYWPGPEVANIFHAHFQLSMKRNAHKYSNI